MVPGGGDRVGGGMGRAEDLSAGEASEEAMRRGGGGRGGKERLRGGGGGGGAEGAVGV